MFQLAALVLAGTAAYAAAQTRDAPHRILIVYETDSTQAAIREISSGLHAGLDQRNPTAFEIYSEYLDSVRFPGATHLDRMAHLLSEKYDSRHFDAAIAVGPAAFEFMLDNRDAVAPGVPLFFGALTEATAAKRALPPDVKGVVSNFDVKGTMKLARQLQPDAKEAVVLFGNAPFDRSWEATARRELGEHYLGFDIRYRSDLTLAGFAEAARQLPPEKAILLLTIYQDADGQKFVPRDAAARIAPQSGAPVYSVYDTFLGSGIVGGYMGTFRDVGEQLAGVVARQINGDATVPQITPVVARPIVDWREIERFGIKPDLLPADAETRYRSMSLWESYRTAILLVIAFVLLQTGLIIGLVVQGNRRKVAEAELATERLELSHLSRASLLGELSGAFAHELNQPLTSILANAQVAKQLLDSGQADLDELRDILSDIVVDDKRAAEVIGQLRRLLTKGEASLEATDLNEIVAATLALAKSELLARQTRLESQQSPSEIPVLGNFAQLQQVVLNLVVNAVDATADRPPPARLVEVTVRRNGDRGELVVTDNGKGLTQDMMRDAFKPFVSTKPKGLGLGLSICSSIVKAHGGDLRFDPEYGKGARVVLSLPLLGNVP